MTAMEYDPMDGAWERYCEAQDQAYERLIYGKTCETCRNCYKPESGMYSDPTVAICWDTKDYIHTTDTPSEFECEDYEE